ncbi:LacI family DNA-binding transcriptional regulator [Parabacteroides sp. APC149_11_2_Y6]
MGASLKDIAKKLNISITTVSWVLSDQGTQKRISKATQDKIWQCAKELNYRPNLLARGLNTGMTGTIGLILPSISDSFYSQVAKAIELEAENYGYTLMIGSSESELERENRIIQMFKSKQIDGLIIAPTKYSKAEIKLLCEESYPFVLFDRYFEDMETNYILINNEECSYELVHRLILDGNRKIAILLTNPHLKIMEMRLNGYKRALDEAGIAFDPDLCGIVEFADFEENIGAVLDNILEKRPDIDSIFFVTHVLAMDTFSHFQKRQINLRDLDMACIHEIPAFHLLVPHMKIAKMPVMEIGRNAVRILHQNIVSKREMTPVEKEALVLKCDIP